MRRWYPENAAKRKAWARLQAAWAKAGQADFRDLADWNEPRNAGEADRDGNPPSRPAPLAGSRQVRRGKL